MNKGVLIGPLILFASVMSLTPGPNVVMVTASAANFGFRRTIPQMLGITLGFGFMVVAVGVGLAGLFHTARGLHTVVRYAGAAYLFYLAWCIAQAEAGGGSTRAKPIGFVEAVLFQAINPKGWVFAIGAVSAYTTVDGDMLWEISVIATVLAVTCLISVLIWGGLGALIGHFLDHSRARTAFNWAMAGLLVLSLLPVFW